MKTIYEANDGTQFETEKECLTYEREQKEKYGFSNVVFLNSKNEILKTGTKFDCCVAIDNAIYIIVKSEKDYEKVKMLNEEVGYRNNFPKYNKRYEGQETIFAYDYAGGLDSWTNLNDLLLKVQEDIAVTLSIIKK